MHLLDLFSHILGQFVYTSWHPRGDDPFIYYIMFFLIIFSTQDSFSTLDLVNVDNVEFLLIIAPIKDSYHLAQAAFEVAEELKVSLKVCVMWQEGATDVTERSKATLLPWKNFIDVVQVKTSHKSPSWWDLCRMTDKGAILVRPDEHIAWCLKSPIETHPSIELKRVFSVVLGLESSCL